MCSMCVPIMDIFVNQDFLELKIVVYVFSLCLFIIAMSKEKRLMQICLGRKEALLNILFLLPCRNQTHNSDTEVTRPEWFTFLYYIYIKLWRLILISRFSKCCSQSNKTVQVKIHEQCGQGELDCVVCHLVMRFPSVKGLFVLLKNLQGVLGTNF